MQPLPSGFSQYRWTGFALLATTFVLGFFHRVAPGVVAPDLMASFGISAAALGSLAAVYYYIYTALQIPSGILSDTLGPRYTVSAAGLIAAAGSVVFGLAEDFTTASIGRMMVGLGVSFTFVGLMKFNTLWFPENRYGLVSGLTLLIGNAGAVLAATPLAWVLAYASWREVFVSVGVVGCVLAVLTFILLRNKPEDAGFPNILTLQGKPLHSQAHRHWSREIYGALRNADVWPGFVVMFGVVGTALAFVGLWIVPLMQDVHGLSRTAAANCATVMLLSTAVGSLCGGSLSDALGRRKPLAILCALCALLGWLGLLYLPWGPGWSIYLLLALIGLSAGGCTVAYAVAKEVAPPMFSGMAIAVVNTGLFAGAAFAQPMFGWAMDVQWQGDIVEGLRVYSLEDYRRGLYLSAGLSLMGLIAALRLKETYCRNISMPAS
ncbi:MAG: MFS transporter [Oceanococcus sp.]